MTSKMNYCPHCGKDIPKEERIYFVRRMRKIGNFSFSYGKKNTAIVCIDCVKIYNSFYVNKKYEMTVSLSDYNW